MEERNIHYNLPQLRSSLVDAPEEYAILGRGTGKTEGILAPKTARAITSMPRSSRVLIGATFQQILTRTLPPLVAGWERLGYKQGIHYLIGVKPSEKWRKKWKWEGPYRPPFKYEYVISWYNGTVQQMISQDRIGTSNGMSIDGIDGDEAKLLNRDRLMSETMPANRGIIHAFRDNPHHHGITFTSDMPVGTAGRWLLDKEQDNDPERVMKILQLQDLKQKEYIRTGGTINRKIQQIDAAMNVLRRGRGIIDGKREGSLVYYHEGSTLENIHGLGLDFIRQLMRNLSDFEFVTSILNRKPMKLEDGFYPDLDEEKHGYFAYDYHKFETTGYDFSRLQQLDGAAVDKDYDPLKPLHISLDYNRRITPMVVAQIHNRYELRVINGMHSLFPKKLEDTLRAFCDYYKHHVKKVVYYWYDHTATAEYSHAGAQCDDVLKYLRANGWVVVERYIGQASGHERRYTMYGHLLQEDDTYPWVLRINRERAKYLLLSMFQAQAAYNKKGFGKDKRTETNPNFPAEESTHYSEALDMLVYGILESNMSIAEPGMQSPGIMYL